MSKLMRLLLTGCLVAPWLAGCGNDTVAPADGADAEEEQATIAELTEDSDRYDGLFTFFRDRETGSVHMLIRPDQLDEEYIYVAKYTDGALEAGHLRGLFVANRVISARRHFERIEFVGENTGFYFDPDNELSRAAEANISHAVMAVAEILAEEDEGLLINVDDVFLSEALHQVKRTPDPEADPKETFTLGKLSEDKSKLLEIRAYPKNVDLFVEYVYDNSAPVVRGGADVTDARYVSARLQHTFIEMPDDGYRTRADDPRMGYFAQRVTDQTSPSSAPWRDVINRWHLVKKDPGAEFSEPVEPIVWWIENTTPVEFREAIEYGVLAWNQAFEQAGFKDAVQVRVQPDDAEWDAGDLRYNVLRWASSPQPAWGGYGPSWVNPRTGQIVGADIMLEYVFVTNRIRQNHLFATALLDTPDSSSGLQGGQHCDLGARLQLNNMLGRAVLKSRGLSAAEEEELVRQSIYMLVLHEVGHALGLNHNFWGSQMLSPDELYSEAVTEQRGLTGSVMDYAPVNLAPPGREQGVYYDMMPGPYDRWAIEYGYSTALDDPLEEQQRLQAILARSTEPGLQFGNDADDMRSPGAGIDPRIMISDYSNDAIRYADDRITLLDETTEGLRDRYAEEGGSYQELYNAYLMLTAELGNQAKVVSRYVGGVHIDRAMQGQPGARVPFTAVPAADQKRAMDFLSRRVFAPEAFDAPVDVYRHLQMQRRGFDFQTKTEDPKIHARALTIQKSVLDHLLHPVVMTRITDSGLYGNEYPLDTMMQELTRAVFSADMSGRVNAFRQGLQLEYVTRLVAIIGPGNTGGYDHPSRSLALYNLQQIRAWMAARTATDTATRAHIAAVMLAIDKALDTA